MKLTRQARRRLAREAAKPTVEFFPSLTKKPQRETMRNVRAGYTTNKGNSPRMSAWAKRRRYLRRFLTYGYRPRPEQKPIPELAEE